MEFSLIFESIFIISIMIALGSVLSRTFPFNSDTRKLLVSLIVNIAMPSIILSSILNVEINRETFKMIAIVIVLSVTINLLGILIGWLFSKTFYRHSTKKREIALLSGLGNTGFIGIPLCAALIGPEGALFAAIFDAGVDITLWTIGVLIIQKNRNFSFQSLKELINVPTIAIVSGLFLAYFNIKPPIVFIELANQLANLAAPLAMFYIGVLVMNLNRKKTQDSGQEIWVPIVVKLIVLPACVALIVTYLNLKSDISQTILIQSMMPSLTLASILFAKHSADENMGAFTTVLSTIVALITIPLMLYLFL